MGEPATIAQPGRDGERLAGLLRALPIEEMERLAVLYFSRRALQRRRLAERAGCILALAAKYHARCENVAAAIARELGRYRGAGWRFQRNGAPPRDERHRLLHRILTVNRGHAVSEYTIRRALAGLIPRG